MNATSAKAELSSMLSRRQPKVRTQRKMYEFCCEQRTFDGVQRQKCDAAFPMKCYVFYQIQCPSKKQLGMDTGFKANTFI